MLRRWRSPSYARTAWAALLPADFAARVCRATRSHGTYTGRGAGDQRAGNHTRVSHTQPTTTTISSAVGLPVSADDGVGESADERELSCVLPLAARRRHSLLALLVWHRPHPEPTEEAPRRRLALHLRTATDTLRSSGAHLTN